MNFSFCLSGVLFLVLQDICLAKVAIKFDKEHEIIEVYADRKRENRHLGHAATFSEEERAAACSYYRPGKYVKNEESKPHIYKVVMPEDLKNKLEKDGAGSSKPDKPESPKAELPKADSPKGEAKDKGPMETEQAETTGLEQTTKDLKLKSVTPEEPGTKESDEEPKMIYDLDIGFRCHTEDPNDEDFILSYGFAQRTLYVSKPVGQIDEKKPLWNRQMKLESYMFVPPILEDLDHRQVHQKYFDLRQRTEKARGESEALLADIETHDDISALTFNEKDILCASLMEMDHYKDKGFEFVPAKDATDYKYTSLKVKFDYEKMDGTVNADFMKCKVKNVKNPNSPVKHIGVTRSYNEGGDLFAAMIDEKAEVHSIDVEVIQMAVLFNRKYAGEREGVLEVLQAIRGVPSSSKTED